MRRQIALTSAIGLLIVTLMVGMAGGAVVGGVAGYWYGHRAEETNPATLTTVDAPDATRVPGDADVPAQTKNEIVNKVNPAVVTIENQLKTPGGSDQTVSMGSGFIIDREGHVVTNNHVVDGADALVVVLLDGTRVNASLVGHDSFQDVAVVKMEGQIPATVSFADSSKVQPGQSVLAIGSALGEFRNTVTDGIIGGVDRSLDTGEGYLLGNLIQHDAPINPGNSGGPLLNLDGQVIGMNTAVVRGGFGQTGAEGLGFAIASNAVEAYAEEIIAHGQVAHPFVGISYRPVGAAQNGSSDSEAAAVMIVDVVADGPADRAGLVAGNIILAVDGTTLDSQHQFLNEVYTHKPGDTVTLLVQRQSGNQEEVKVTLGDRAENAT